MPRRRAQSVMATARRGSKSARPATITVRPSTVRAGAGAIARWGPPRVASDPGSTVRSAGELGWLGRRRGIEHEWLAQRQIEVDRAGAPLERRPPGAAGQLADPAHRVRIDARRKLELAEPLRRVSVELDLVDRLPGSDVAQLGGAVGGEDDQRDARPVGLDHGRHELGGGGPRRAGDRDRSPAGLRGADGEEAGAALVDVGEAPQSRLAGKRQHDRRVARARRGARFAHSAAGELVDERAQESVRCRRCWA